MVLSPLPPLPRVQNHANMGHPHLDHLFPISEFRSGFTTSSVKHDRIEHVHFEDHALGVHKVSSRTSHRIVTPPTCKSSNIPPPKEAWEALYPKGSINPAGKTPGGFGFHVAGPKAFAEHLANGATEVVFSYRMMLEEGWEWVKGGKLPGVCEFA
jgi:hypothetical protein